MRFADENGEFGDAVEQGRLHKFAGLLGVGGGGRPFVRPATRTVEPHVHNPALNVRDDLCGHTDPDPLRRALPDQLSDVDGKSECHRVPPGRYRQLRWAALTGTVGFGFPSRMRGRQPNTQTACRPAAQRSGRPWRTESCEGHNHGPVFTTSMARSAAM
jgi:hypothetical protein